MKNSLQIPSLFAECDRMQKIYGDPTLDPVYGCGNINHPKFFLVFMNPTAKNVATNKKWKGLKAPWIGTKNIWNMLYHLGYIEEAMIHKIRTLRGEAWDDAFAQTVYREIARKDLYITNLSKATQKDAHGLADSIYKAYLPLLLEEITAVNPQNIVLFGNQVSSIVLQKKISVAKARKQYESIIIEKKSYKAFPVYYPIGQGMRNIHIAKEDLAWIGSQK